jgi:rubrerythrin
MTKSTDNLMAAFAGESQANRRYLAFAKKADAEGYTQVAKLFRAAAQAETVHALNHLRALGAVKSTAENLKAAIEGEHYENTVMYPEFIKTAEEEKDRKALGTFKDANAVEKVHEDLYTQALAGLELKDEEVYDYYVCPVCGNTYARTAPDKCEVCGTLGSKFELVR